MQRNDARKPHLSPVTNSSMGQEGWEAVIAAHLQPGHMAVPGSEALRMLCCHAGGRAVGPPEHNGHGDGASGHVERLCRRVDDLVDGLHGKVKGHELAHTGRKPAMAAPVAIPVKPACTPKKSTCPHVSVAQVLKAAGHHHGRWGQRHLCDGSVPNSLRAIFL